MNLTMGTSILEGATIVHHDRTSARSLTFVDGHVAAYANDGFRIDVRDHLIFPGLINAHDHLQLNNVPPLRHSAPFGNSYEWIDAMAAHRESPAVRAATAVSRDTRHWHGGLKNILSGVTTVAHHDAWHDALGDAHFPVAVPHDLGWCHSLKLAGPRGAESPQYGPPVRVSYDATPSDRPWIIHLAEGTDEVARSELEALDVLGCLASNTVLVHGVALSDADVDTVIARGARVVWCPASNVQMFGCTLDPSTLFAAGRLSLGTDSRLTGSRDLLDELRIAADYSELSPRELLQLVTESASTVLRLPDRGRLRAGHRADCIILRAGADPRESLLSVHRRDLRAVVRDGRPVIADPDFADWFAHCDVDATAVLLDGSPKLLAAPLARVDIIALEPGLELA